MKKIVKNSLSVLMTLMIVFSIGLPTFAIDTASVQILESTGVIPLEKTFDDKIITRAEFVKMATTLLYPDVENLEFGETPFIDFSKENEFSHYISVAYGQGLISGTGGAYFYPDAPIKYIDAVKIMTDALGYGAVVNLDDGYANGFAKFWFSRCE